MLKPYNRAQLCFHLGQEIGHEGGNSKVFLAHDPQLNAELVIKQVPKNTLTVTEFFQESGVLYQSGHPNVVPIHYACEDIDHIYLAMPYYPNGSINAQMQSRFLTVREIIKYASQFLSGLHNIHSKGLIHFDVKPDNILVSDRFEAVVSDFGLCKPMASNGLAGQDTMYHKMTPPEAFDTEYFSTTFDIYQVGLTLYRMCVGNQAFYSQYQSFEQNGVFDREGFKFAVKNGRFPDRDTFSEHIPQALISVIKKCLAPDPLNRYQAVLHITNDISAIDDNLLDWKMAVEADGTRKWSKTIGDKTVSLTVQTDGSSLATKTHGSTNTRRISKYCVQSIGRQKIKAFLREH